MARKYSLTRFTHRTDRISGFCSLESFIRYPLSTCVNLFQFAHSRTALQPLQLGDEEGNKVRDLILWGKQHLGWCHSQGFIFSNKIIFSPPPIPFQNDIFGQVGPYLGKIYLFYSFKVVASSIYSRIEWMMYKLKSFRKCYIYFSFMININLILIFQFFSRQATSMMAMLLHGWY